MTDEFQLKGLFPFFATFVHALGFDVRVWSGADRKALKRGIEEANVPFCAPMQQYHGLVAEMADAPPGLPLPPHAARDPARDGASASRRSCPIVQGAPDMLRWDLGTQRAADRLARGRHGGGLPRLGAVPRGLPRAGGGARRDARDDVARGLEGRPRGAAALRRRAARLGERALAFCGAEGVTPVVVLGRSYTIHNDVLNSNVPSHPARAGRHRHPGGLLPGARRRAGLRGRLLGLRPAHPARGLAPAAPARDLLHLLLQLLVRPGQLHGPRLRLADGGPALRHHRDRRPRRRRRHEDARRGLPPLRARGPARRRGAPRARGRAAHRAAAVDAGAGSPPGAAAHPAHGPRG